MAAAAAAAAEAEVHSRGHVATRHFIKYVSGIPPFVVRRAARSPAAMPSTRAAVPPRRSPATLPGQRVFVSLIKNYSYFSQDLWSPREMFIALSEGNVFTT